MRSFLLAWHFLTAIPLARQTRPPQPEDLARSMRWYPVIGLLLGGLLVGLDQVLGPLFARPVVDALLVTALVLITRALHQDGLADTADGFVGGHHADDRLAIMRDPRVGAFGATALVLSLGLRYAGLLALPNGLRWPVLLCMPALGRWAMVVGAASAPYARKEGGLAAGFLAGQTWRDLAWAAVPLTAALVGAMGARAGLAGIALATGIGAAFALLSRRLCGGITGDTLGATNELAELACLLLLPALIVLL